MSPSPSAVNLVESVAQVELHGLRLRNGCTISDAILSDTEKARAAAFRSPTARNLFVGGRILCRNIVGAMVGCTPKALRIALALHGRPFLPDHPDIDFNLSHAGGVIGLAVAHGTRVGLDIEPTGANANLHADETAPLVLSDHELQAVSNLASTRQRPALLFYWVRKEAVLKCLGKGFLINPRSVTLNPTGKTADILNASDGEPVFLRCGAYRFADAGPFLWAVASSRNLPTPSWRYHDDFA